MRMQNLQNEKKIVLDYFNDINNCDNEDLAEVISNHTSENFHMRCTHPFNEIKGCRKYCKSIMVTY